MSNPPNLFNMAPARAPVDEAYMEHDRSFFRRWVGVKVLVRFLVNGEQPWELSPGLLTVSEQTKPGARLRKNIQPMFGSTKPLPEVEPDEPFAVAIPGPFAGCVYIAKRRDEHKIGMTKDLLQRLISLERTFKIEGLSHFIITDNPKRLEKILHRRFASRRMSGEWFRLSSEDLQEIQTVAAVLIDHNSDFLLHGGAESEHYIISPWLISLPALPYLDEGNQEFSQHFPGLKYLQPDPWPVDWAMKPDDERLKTMAHYSPDQIRTVVEQIRSPDFGE